MKYFIPLHPLHLPRILGPFPDETAIVRELDRLVQDTEVSGIVVDGVPFIIAAKACEKPMHEKRMPGNMERYQKAGDHYLCRDCGSSIVNMPVIHPVAFHGLSVSCTETECRTVRYCPRCEQRPACLGETIFR